MSRPEPSDYEHGVTAGQVIERLAEHDRRLLGINGSIDENTRQLAALTLAVQRLADAAEADRATQVTTAAALEKDRSARAVALADERQAQRDDTDKRWSPLTRASIAVGIVAAVTGIVVAILAHLG